MSKGVEVQFDAVTDESNTGDAASDSVRTFSEEVEIAIQALKTVDRPVKTSELPSLVQGINWGTNVSAKMKKLIRSSNGQIFRSGRGVYEFRCLDN